MMTLADRMTIVAACRYVDQVMVNTGDEDSKPAILLSGATHIIHGSDWTGKILMRHMGLTQEWLDRHKIQMVYYPYTDHVTSRMIRAKIFSRASYCRAKKAGLVR